MNEEKLCVIGGELLEALSGQRIENICPTTGEDIARAVEADQEAYDNVWSKVPPLERGQLLAKLAHIIKENAENIALIDTMDMGKPIEQSQGDAVAAAGFFRYFGELTGTIQGNTLIASEGHFGYTMREPYGVVGAIMPWNSPAVMVASKCPPDVLSVPPCARL